MPNSIEPMGTPEGSLLSSKMARFTSGLRSALFLASISMRHRPVGWAKHEGMVGLKTKYQPCGAASDLGKNSSTFSVVRFDLVNSLAPLIGPIVDLKEGKVAGR